MKISEYMKVRSDAKLRYKIGHYGWVLLSALKELKRKKVTQWYIEEFIIDIKELQGNLDEIYKSYGKYNIENELIAAKSIEIKTLHDCEDFVEEYLKIGKKITKDIKWYLRSLIIEGHDAICNLGEFLLISIIFLILIYSRIWSIS